MAHHMFYPSSEMPSQIGSYIEGLKAHHDVFGDVPNNTPGDVKELPGLAGKLKPLADDGRNVQVAR